MTPAVIITLAILYALSLLSAFFCGAWIAHRAATKQSPIPDVPAALRAMIEVIRAKPKPVNHAVNMPRMRA